jgi:hypothetical protein
MLVVGSLVGVAVAGNPSMFERQAAVGSQLLEFGMCAGLLRAPNAAMPVPRSEGAQ